MLPTAIVLAAIGALGLAVGTHLQHRAVRVGTPFEVRRANAGVLRSFAHPLWLLGTGIIVVETVLNIVALGLAPLAVVQPIGSAALVCAVIISALALGVRVRRGLVLGILLTVLSVAAFVVISAGFSREVRPTGDAVSQLAWIILVLVLVSAVIAYRRAGHLMRVAGAGALFGTVASAMHVVATEVVAFVRSDTTPGVSDTADPVSAPLLWMLVALLIAGSAVGAWLVQTAYASGPPETVLAGLTVIDPLVAVLVGTFVLGEYSTIPLIGVHGLVLSGLAACLGIAVIVRNHPAIADRSPGAQQILPAPPATVAAELADRDGAAGQNRKS